VRAEVITIVHDAVPGRLRLRLAGLRGNAGFAVRLAALAQTEAMWLRADVRAGTDSVILHHAPHKRPDCLVERLRSMAETARSHDHRDVPSMAGPVTAATGGRQPPHAARPLPALQETEPWHARVPEAVAAALHSHDNCGLAAQEARMRLQNDGPNVLPQDEHRRRFALVKDQFKSLPVLGVQSRHLMDRI
jgi:P-type Ca2+ transporter type 2C